MNGTCKKCGGDSAIHHYQTNQCPVGGREAPIGKPDEWQDHSFFEAVDFDTVAALATATRQLADAVAALNAILETTTDPRTAVDAARAIAAAGAK
jgi:hypothetical protein